MATGGQRADTGSCAAGSEGASAGASAGGEPAWLSGEEQDAWKAMIMIVLQLQGPLDAQLQRDSRITMFEYLVLSSLSMARDRAVHMSELATLSNSSLSRLSNVVKRMEQRGWLLREPDPEDGRYTVARLTDSGMGIVEEAAPGHVAAVRRLVIDPLTPGQLRTLASIGRRLEASMGLLPGGRAQR